MTRAIAAQALSACDRLEEGVRNGDQESIERSRVMLRKWAEGSEGEVVITIDAMRSLLRSAADGDLEDLLTALKALRKMAEEQMEVADET